MSEVVKITPPNDALGKARTNVERAKDEWASKTINGFMSKWATWYSNFVVPALVRIRLPRKTGSIRDNVINRVTPVAEAISRASGMYRQQKNTQYVQLTPVPPAPSV